MKNGAFRIVGAAVAVDTSRILLFVPTWDDCNSSWHTFFLGVAGWPSDVVFQPLLPEIPNLVWIDQPIFFVQFPIVLLLKSLNPLCLLLEPLNNPCFLLKSLCLSPRKVEIPVSCWWASYISRLLNLRRSGACALCGLSTACFGGLVRDILCRCLRWEGVFHSHGGTPIDGWFIWKNHEESQSKMDDD